MLKTLPHAIPKVASPTEKIPNEGFNSNIEQVQAYLTRHYEFKYNSVTQRLLVRIRNADEQYHYLEDYEFNSILKNNQNPKHQVLKGYVADDFKIRLCPTV